MSAEKSQPPTDKKLRDARRKGQVAKSKEVVSTLLIIAMVAMIMGLSDYYMTHFGELMLLPAAYVHLPFGQALHLMVDSLLREAIYLCLPLMIMAVLVAIFSHLMQSGFLFSGEPIKPDIKKINPVEGMKKIFSVKNLIDFIKSILKVALLTVLVWSTLKNDLKTLLLLPYSGLGSIAAVTGQLVHYLMMMCAAGFLLISAIDYALERFQHHKQLRMSKDEVKREHKEMDGSPEIKAQRRQLHRELQSGSMRADVKRSSVIVTNPTHIAVGIRYQPGETPLPLVTLMYTDALALRVRQIAQEEGIPVLERVPLARALHSDGLVDQYIPAELIEPTAEVLRWLHSQQKQG
ncbi:type III secretion system export apparatus subunit SctU [Pseudomonas fontis]|uniref:Type III secretion system export apparatus subunit SctU n=1 Tax=Pseudomonas fontis TaxID=2942633 RepID=A0ABT5NZW3_9PSED|nr:type III secretion system export apparatus subunit SctU [Pseudomonas fontis]MDD0976386.1 type III secretion system export apparatus subunit SctU [Pseudomonas fontis]MDD0993728.1 type III secretion system export apparatus subunit SctU [Pseudomonas fontis]